MLDESRIRTGIKVNSWQDAIRSAGEILVAAKSCKPSYVDAMVDAVLELGPYIVITPHVALAHARPSSHVIKADMSLAILEKGVDFNSVANDPVKVVFAFCATNTEAHLQHLQSLATKLNPEIIAQLSTAKSVKEVVTILS